MPELSIVLKGKDEASPVLKKVSGQTAKTKKSFASLGQMLSVGALAVGFKKALSLYETQIKAETRLDAALKTTGVFSEELSKRLREQASALQEVTIYGDEAILSGMALMKTMGLEASMLEAGSKAAIGLADSLNIDLNTAFLLVGRAAAGDTALLKRYGITIDETLSAQEKLNELLRRGALAFEDTSKSIRESGIGPLKALQMTMGDVTEDIVREFIPELGELADGFRKVAEITLPVFKAIWIRLKGFFDAMATGGSIIYALFTKQWKALPVLFKDMSDKFKKDDEAVRKAWQKTQKTQRDEIKKTVEGAKKASEEMRGIWSEMTGEEAKELGKAEEKRAGLFDKRIETEKGRLEEELNFRREFRAWDLEDVMSYLEQRKEMENISQEERMAADEALSEFRKAKDMERAEGVKVHSEEIAGYFSSALQKMMKGEANFAEAMKGFWSEIRNMAFRAIADIMAEELRSLALKVFYSKKEAASKAMSAHAGIPFVGLAVGMAAASIIVATIARLAGMEKGGIIKEPTIALLGEKRKREAIIPLESPEGRKMLGGMGGVTIENINIQFPAVTTFQDWLEADPELVKEVTERKLFEAFRTLAEEDRMEEVVR